MSHAILAFWSNPGDGFLGWYVNARLLKRRTVPGLQARINAMLVPILRLEDRLGLAAGLSLLAVGRR